MVKVFSFILLLVFYFWGEFPNLMAGDVIEKHTPKTDTRTLVFADEIVHYKEMGLILARGHVEIERDGRVLYADVVTYNEKKDLVTATGNVRLEEPSGEVIFSRHTELKADMKDGFVEKVKMILPDDARLTSPRADRIGGEKSHFQRPLYSPCRLCKLNPSKPPLWQVKARHATWDEIAEDVYYTDATLEMWGIPMLYTPYLRHPAPNVKRRSGLLTQRYGYTTNLGTFAAIPYYWVISQDKDLTLMPVFGTKYVILSGEYRQRFERGLLVLKGSGSPGEKILDKRGKAMRYSDETRWHTDSFFRYDLNKTYRMGIDLQRASDPTYLKRYTQLGYTSRSHLTSRAYVERFQGRSYGVLQGYAFQGLREGDRDATTPRVLPYIEYNYLSAPDSFGGRFSIDLNHLTISRREGTDASRTSLIGGWEKPWTTRLGEVYTIGGKVRGDGFYVNGFRKSKRGPEIEDRVGRGFAKAYANWRWPFLRPSGTARMVLEPIAGIVVAPNSGQHKNISNEDCRFLEMDDLNFMDDERFSGFDYLDGGSRFHYGFNFSLFSKQYGNSSLFLGQNLAFSKPRRYLVGTGFDRQWSDIVARLRYAYEDWLELKARALMDRKSGHEKRNEVAAFLGKPLLRLTTEYAFLPKLAEDISDRAGRQMKYTLSSQFLPEWNVFVSVTRQLGVNAGELAHEAGITYQDECFTAGTTMTKTFFIDQDVKPGLTFMFRLVFKNLGEISQTFGKDIDPITGEATKN